MIVLGLFAGYYLGWIDAVISRSIEVFLVIPLLLAALLLLSLFRNVNVGTGTFNDILLAGRGAHHVRMDGLRPIHPSQRAGGQRPRLRDRGQSARCLRPCA